MSAEMIDLSSLCYGCSSSTTQRRRLIKEKWAISPVYLRNSLSKLHKPFVFWSLAGTETSAVVGLLKCQSRLHCNDVITGLQQHGKNWIKTPTHTQFAEVSFLERAILLERKDHGMFKITASHTPEPDLQIQIPALGTCLVPQFPLLENLMGFFFFYEGWLSSCI